MEWIEAVKDRIKRKRSVLFDVDREPLCAVYAALAGKDRKTVILWALALAENCAERLAELGERDADSDFATILAARMWAAGDIKMPEARRAILYCHAAAKTAGSREAAALFHAVGQACSSVHTPRHAPGLCVYELTAYVLRYGADGCREAVEGRADEYLKLLGELSSRKNEGGRWAKFLIE